jgi:hypothetical protein
MDNGWYSIIAGFVFTVLLILLKKLTQNDRD